MEFLDRKYGPFSGRLWGLFANFFANGVAVYGAIKHMVHGEDPKTMYAGLIASAVICMVVAIPSKKMEEQG